jgi:hypothetical protein
MGNLHRSVVGAGKSFYVWLKLRHFPKGYQTLCFNCNHAKHTRGVCPHKANRRATGDTKGMR